MNVDRDNVDFLFIGGVFPKEKEEEIIRKSKSGLQMAANNFQWSLIHGFDRNLSKPITILNTIFIGSYPKNYSDCIIHGEQFTHTPGAKDYNLGFINLTILKQFLRPFNEKKILKEWLNANKKESNKIVFIYSLSPRSARLAKLIKQINPDAFTCVSVNDLPQNIMLGIRGNKKIVQIWKNLFKKKVEASLKYIDGFMIVSEQIAESLNINNKPYIVVEALTEIDPLSLPIINRKDDKIKRIVYTGGLIEKYGIINLIQAFSLIESDEYQLIICGDGDCKEAIIEMSKADNRIVYLGVLSPDKVKKIQQSATVLVNPRQNTGDFTKYSFPIKTIEYLLSGKPVIGYKLDGIPHEYDEHLIYVEDNSLDAIKNKIIEVCTMPEKFYSIIGNKNIEFVAEQKNNIIQTKRILSMIIDQLKKRRI
ncbi:glycosyltransferase [uncultured Proteiniphilum sp.]|uniref:glycosyltransferase n=1 Tax=uncultured Proteiniphilum sp. TaxID=497637 RepID=UPI002636D0B2|nr:glycosyltransferase [uncultured Proteiniphilum sp.]